MAAALGNRSVFLDTEYDYDIKSDGRVALNIEHSFSGADSAALGSSNIKAEFSGLTPSVRQALTNLADFNQSNNLSDPFGFQSVVILQRINMALAQISFVHLTATFDNRPLKRALAKFERNILPPEYPPLQPPMQNDRDLQLLGINTELANRLGQARNKFFSDGAMVTVDSDSSRPIPLEISGLLQQLGTIPWKIDAN
jgi:hypothetical protein